MLKLKLQNYDELGVPSIWLCILGLLWCVFAPLIAFFGGNAAGDIMFCMTLILVGLYVYGRMRYKNDPGWLQGVTSRFVDLAPVDEYGEMARRDFAAYEDWIIQRAFREEIDIDQAAALLDAKAQFDYDVAVQMGVATSQTRNS